MPATVICHGDGSVTRTDPRSLDEAKAERRAVIAEERWRAETGGVAWRDRTVSTDRESQQMISAAASRADRDPGFATPWKLAGADGAAAFAMLDAAALHELRAAVEEHVRGCFAREGLLLQQIALAGTNADVDRVVW